MLHYIIYYIILLTISNNLLRKSDYTLFRMLRNSETASMQTQHVIFHSRMRATCSCYLMLLDLRTVVLMFKQCKVRSLLPCSSFQTFLPFYSFDLSEIFTSITLRIRQHNKTAKSSRRKQQNTTRSNTLHVTLYMLRSVLFNALVVFLWDLAL